MNEYQNLCDKVDNIIREKGYRLQVEVINETYVFNIYNNETSITNLEIVNSTGTILAGKTRSQYQNQSEDHDILHIKWVCTEKDYRGQNLALLIMIYSICYLKQQFPNINYVTLDDDSDRSCKIEKNIYNSLGFSFRDPIEMDMERPNRLKISGPEKQLLLDNIFIERANAKLNEINRMGGKHKSKKNRKAKRNRKTKRNGKTKRNRKTKRKL